MRWRCAGLLLARRGRGSVSRRRLMPLWRGGTGRRAAPAGRGRFRAGDDGQVAALRYPCNGFAGQAGVVAGGAGFVGREDVDEAVGNEGALDQCGLRGANLHTAVDGDRVATDDLARKLLGQRKGKSCLSAGGRAGDDDERSLLRGLDLR